MNKTNKPSLIYDQGWLVKAFPPENMTDAGILVMLHGWTGDETSTSVFTRSIPRDRWILAPRGIIKTSEGGYGWISHRPGRDATLALFLQVADKLRKAVTSWMELLEIKPQPIHLLGFSQGAALALSYALRYPTEVERLACISGFLPYLPENFKPDPNIGAVKFFIAHGSNDDMIPLERAREIEIFLKNGGADPVFCQHPSGHRISAGCFQKLAEFFNEVSVNAAEPEKIRPEESQS